ncbi:MAG TPA: serine/threonine-protein kinase [Thermoleophilaceae bacterium]
MSRIVGRYEILDRLGEGGMADVFLARQLDLDRLVALKELRALSGADSSLTKRFLREARMAGSLSHPNIVTVHDYIESEGTPFIAMEYMERGSLRPQIGRLSLAQAGGVLGGVLAGLDYAGARGIVHRDIKPENVMIGADGRVKIADFGIAKARDAFQTSGALTAEGTALGTPNYMAPEQAAAEEVGPWTDLYAVGVMAFEFFVGRPPFADTPAPLVVLMRQVNDPVPRVTDIDPQIDPRIADWIAWLTAKDPAARPQTAGQAWDQFEGILLGLLGPRWQRGARLLPGVAAAAAAAATDVIAGAPTPPTQPLADAQLAPTVAPNPNLLGIDRTAALGMRSPDDEPTQRAATPGRRGRVIAATAAAVVLAAVAFGALRHDSGPARAAQQPPPTAKKRAPAAAAPVSAAPATQPASVAADPGLSTQAAEARDLARQYNAGAAKIEALAASGGQAGQNAILAGLMRKVARAYSRAYRAAKRGDAAGYNKAIADANAAKAELDQAAAASQTAPSASSDNSGGSDNAAGSSSACAGDSASDDPSDDDCGGGGGDEP